MFFLVRIAFALAGPIVKGVVLIAVIGVIMSVVGLEPMAIAESYLKNWLWSQL